MTVKTIHVETGAWMRRLENKDGLTVYLSGRIMDLQDTLAVSVQGTGATRFYCEKHQRVYHPLDQCPDCKLQTI
jgi:hypothetical protein